MVQKACIQADLDNFVNTLPQGYETIVGQKGLSLSGGQRQRIAIARAIVQNPRILILDEATSALDTKTEKGIEATLQEISKGRTTLVISHKLSTIQKADKVVLMDKGQVTEQGTHEHLMSLGGRYSRMVSDLAENSLGSKQAPIIIRSQPSHDSTPAPSPEKVASDTGAEKTSPRSQSQLEDGKLVPNQARSLFTSILTIFQDQKHLIKWMLFGLAFCVVAGAVYPGQAIVFGKTIAVLQKTGSDLDSSSRFWALMWFVLALGVLIAFGAIGAIFTILATHTNRYYRAQYFRATLQQNLSYFNQAGNSPGALTARLSNHTEQLQSLVSTTSGLLLVIIVDLVSSIILAIVVEWRLALVAVFGSMPPIVFAAYLRVRLAMKAQDDRSHSISESVKLATEISGAMKTITSLNLESRLCRKYEDLLNEFPQRPWRSSSKRMLLYAFAESARMLSMLLNPT